MRNDLVNHKSRESLRLAFDTVETACRPENATISVSNSSRTYQIERGLQSLSTINSSIKNNIIIII